MEIKEATTKNATAQGEAIDPILSSATKLTPLELNNIRLDIRHTILTPDYLENIIREKSEDDKSKSES